uniref:GAP family protein n=1 Tax=Actinosynnema sp. TaxID=1872144 RepID=UPI003F8718A1
MGAKDLLTVAGLALLDSLNITLFLVTLHLLLAHRRPMSRVLVFLGVFYAVYLAAGVALTAGAVAALGAVGERGIDYLQLAAGLGLFVYGIAAPVDKPARIGDVREAGRGLLVVAGVALGVWAVEVSTALPYLAAISTIGRADPGTTTSTAVLAVYNLVVVAPCLGAVLAYQANRERLHARFEGFIAKRRSGDGGRRGLLLLCIV